MEPKLIEIGARIEGLRKILGLSTAEMASVTGISQADYETRERGEADFSFTFLYKCAERFGIDLTELLTGENPRLSSYTVVRAGTGLPIRRRAGFAYYHLAARMKNKTGEPFLVVAPYLQEEAEGDIHLSTHEGQEMNYVLEGVLRFRFGEQEEILRPGDSVYYDSGKPHGMVAIEGAACRFLAIVMKGEGKKDA